MSKLFIYMENNQLKPDLPKFDMSELQPIPAFQPNVKDEIQFQNTGWILFALIIIVITCIILIRFYVKLNKKTSSLSLSKILSHKNLRKKSKKVQEEEVKEIIVPEKVQESEDIENKEQEFIPEQNVVYQTNENTPISLKLGTPRSIEKCILNFLELTREF